MAKTPIPSLHFVDACSDCGYRQVTLPEPLPLLGDDFDWLVRDYDGFRLSMLEEMAARFPERRRWTPADMEVVLIESLSVVLDQLSDMLDRVQSEAFLATARRPESVRRLLNMIGFDSVSLAKEQANIPQPIGTVGEDIEQKRTRLSKFQHSFKLFLNQYPQRLAMLTASQQDDLAVFIQTPKLATAAQLESVQYFIDIAPDFVQRSRNNQLERFWQLHPREMNLAREQGPKAIHSQKRMVTMADYAQRMTEHPLVLRAHCYGQWSGSWNSLYVAVVLTNNIPLDQALEQDLIGSEASLLTLQSDIEHFNLQQQLSPINWNHKLTARSLLKPFLDANRMVAQEVFLQDAELVGINISVSIRVSEHYFRSEIRQAVEHSLSTGLNGFFAPGRLQFGEDLHSSDVIEVLMALDGVVAVCLNQFKRVGRRYPNQADAGLIELSGLQIATCNNDTSNPEYGALRCVLHGGRRG